MEVSKKKFRKGKAGEAIRDLPEELIREILLRLSVKSLNRFKSVSMSWLSLISNPRFAKSHFELASYPADRLVYLTHSHVRSIDVNMSFNDNSCITTLNFPRRAPFDEIHILGSCRGFLLLNDTKTISVWNPTTGFCKELPNSPMSVSRGFKLTKYGFGYDSSSDDYIVVLAYNQSNTLFATHFDFLSLRNNSWGKAEVTRVIVCYERSGTCLNGAIHWLAYWPADPRGVIVAFDLAQKSLRGLHVPKFLPTLDSVTYKLGVIGGCLSLSSVESYKTEIWVMKEYGLESSWERSIILCESPAYFIPTCFTEDGRIIGNYCGEGLVKCNHEGELLEHLTYDYNKDKAVMYTQCLLSLPSDTEGGRKARQLI